MTTTTLLPATEELVRVDPATLKVRDQAREDATPDDALIASVRKHGIIQPPVIEAAAGGGFVIVTGHRRVGAAIAAGLPEISCILRSTPDGSEALTLEQQIVENERRKQLSTRDLVAGYQKLSLFGLRPEDIAAGLGESADRVRAGLRVVKSKPVQELLEQTPTVDLEQAAVIAEFDDAPSLQAELITTATTRPENFARDVHAARSRREVEARVDALKRLLDEAGVPFLGSTAWDNEWYRGDGDARTLARLEVDPDEHASCPGHAALIHNAHSSHLSKQPTEWLLYVCTAWEQHGHAVKGQGAKAPQTPEEIAAAEARAAKDAEWERRQAEHRARQEVIAANTTARREWLHGYLTNGRLRLSNPHFDLIAASVAAQWEAEDLIAPHIILTLLDGQPHERDTWRHHPAQDELTDAIATGRIHSTRIIVATAAAFFEEELEGAMSGPYWTALEAFGYTLTDTDREHLAASAAALAEKIADESDTADDDDEDVEGGDDE